MNRSVPLLLASALLGGSAQAQVYKCEVAGSVVYQQAPCEGGRGKEVEVSPNTVDRLAPPRTRSGGSLPAVPPRSLPPRATTRAIPGDTQAFVGGKGVPPLPSSPTDPAPRVRDLIAFARQHPAPSNPRSRGSPQELVGGLSFWPAVPITAEGVAVLDEEQAAFEPTRLATLACRPGFAVGAKVQVVRLTMEAGIPLPVFLTADAEPLRYFEVSLDVGTYPVLLHIFAGSGAAVRVTTSAQTRLAGVQVNSRFPSVVLGVDPRLVAARYSEGDGLPTCNSGGILATEVAGTVPHRVESSSRAAVGEPQVVRRLPPRLGEIVDPDVRLPNSYGSAMLEHLGYVRRMTLLGGSAHGVYLEVLKPFRIPEGLGGAHQVTFVVRPGGPIPSGNLSHSRILELPQGSSPSATRQ